MASFDLTGFSAIQRTLADGEYGFIGQNGALAVSSGHAITGSGSFSVTNLGAISTVAATAIFSSSGGVGINIYNGPNGTITSSGGGGVSLAVADHTLIANDGAISGYGAAIRAERTDGFASIRITNNGTLSGYNAVAAHSGNAPLEITNTGEMLGHTIGIDVLYASQTGTVYLTNTGTIAASSFYPSFRGSIGGTDIVVNAGLMIGDVDLGGGIDVYDGRGGHVIGRVEGGLGSDTYILDRFDTEIFERDGEGTDKLEVADDVTLPRFFEDLTLRPGGDFRGTGNSQNNFIVGNDWNNVLFGLDGDDIINVGGGDDIAYGGNGDDFVGGSTGGVSTFYGGDGDDWLEAFGAEVWMTGDRGADLLDGSFGVAIADYGAEGGDFGVIVNLSSATRYNLAPGTGRDTWRFVDTYKGVDGVIGTDRPDKIVGSDALEVINAGGGADLILAEGGDDILRGEGGDDRIFGWRGADRLFGGDGDDMLQGEFDDDLIQGGAGTDRLFGGSGRDTFVFENGFGEDRVIDYNTNLEKLDFSGHTLVASIADLTITETAGSAVILDPEGNRLVLVGVAAATISTGDFIF